MNVLISGAGIAGATLAFWLRRYGFTPTLLEQAPRPRTSGYVVDFWGTGFDIAGKMGLLPTLKAQAYNADQVKFVDENGERIGGFPVDILEKLTNGRYLTIARSDLALSIYDAIGRDTETIFGEQICDLRFGGDDVEATFFKMEPRRFDIVVGADGLHSDVRQLAFGPESQYERYLGYKVAAFEVGGYRERDERTYVSYNRPGIHVARFATRGDRTLFLLIFADKDPSIPVAHDVAARRRELHARFDGKGWECDEIMSAMDRCDSVYFDRISQIRMPSWFKDRCVLVGDAAAAPSLLAGQGAALAVVEAYVLAGELSRTPANASAAFARYEATLRNFVDTKQVGAERFAGSFAPKTELGLLVRNWMSRFLNVPIVAEWMIGAQTRDDIVLPDYSLASLRAA